MAVDEILVAPAKLVAESLEAREGAGGLEALDAKGVGDHQPVLRGVGRRNALVDVEALESGLSTLSLDGEHPADTPPDDEGGRAVLERAAAGVGVHPLLQEVTES